MFLRIALVCACALRVWAGADGAEGKRITGVVRDAQRGVVVGAEVTLLNAQQAVLGATRTDAQGHFGFEGVPRGRHLLVARAAGFEELRLVVQVERVDVDHVEATLSVLPVHAAVTVTATPGQVEDAGGLSQPVNVIGGEELQWRAKAVLAQAAEGEVGVHLQRTSPTVGGIFIRGLTGNKVNVFIDGVRYTTAAQRGGINTFLNLIEPSSLEAVEILRGPNSGRYGSDAIGGSVQFLSLVPPLGADTPVAHGSFSASGNTADASYGAALASSYGARRFGVVGNVAGRRANTLRAGRGLDSHSAVTRFFGLPSDRFYGSRLPDTAFTQYAGLLRLHGSLAPGTQLIVHYSRGQQDGGKRYDQLLGGEGNTVADLRNLMLDFFYLRYDQQRAGWFDHLSLTYSFNSQREERVNQGGNGDPRATVVHEYERTRVHGIQGSVLKHGGRRNSLVAGGEYYQERVRAPAFGFNPVTREVARRRPRVPDRARYRSGGLYVQDVLDVVPERLRVVGNVRYSQAGYRVRAEESPRVNGQALWPDDALQVSSVTFRAGVVVAPAAGLALSANVSRGYRAPHITDLGTLGITGSGFEVAAPDVAGLGATVGNTADGSAVSTGRLVDQVRSEISLTSEFGVRYRRAGFQTHFAFFVNSLDDLIVKQALILPPGAVGLVVGGQAITAQNPGGAVFVAAASSPVLVRANLGGARIHGFEHTLELPLGRAWSLATTYTYLRAEDRQTGRPPDLEGGTPAPDGFVKLRYAPPKGRFWIEPYAHAAGRQSRLSSLDQVDRRTGALRTRASIRSFFLNGATVRGLVGPGPDGILGTSDDRLLATGETLAEVQDRVLGPGTEEALLWRGVPGYVVFSVRGGFRIGERHEVLLDFHNLGDRNYRGISWGLDSPGRSLAFRYAARF